MKKKNKNRALRRLAAMLLAALLLFVSLPPCEAEAATTVTLTLMSYSGSSVLQTIQVRSGTYVTLPTNKDTTKTVFMGWSTVKSRKKDPTYLPDQRIKVRKNMTLYEVRFKRSSDKVPYASTIPALNAAKYERVIFVGDSRIAQIKRGVKKYYGDPSAFLNKRKVGLVARSGTGLADFICGTGSGSYARLKTELGKTSGRQVVIFAFGINDLRANGDVTAIQKAYATFLKTFRRDLKKNYNCDLYLMSVNPINQNETYRREEHIRSFNKYLKAAGVCDGYIDTYSYLYENGFNFWHYSQHYDDGVHYSLATTLRIFRYAMQTLNAG